MTEDNTLRFHAYKQYGDVVIPFWVIYSDNQEVCREICRVVISPKQNKEQVDITFNFGGKTNKYFCRFDREQTLIPGIKRVVYNDFNDVAGSITYAGLYESTVNEHILVQIEGLRINFFDVTNEEKKLLAYCYMYDDRDTLDLCCSRATATCFSVNNLEKHSPADLMMTLIYPIIGFI